MFLEIGIYHEARFEYIMIAWPHGEKKEIKVCLAGQMEQKKGINYKIIAWPNGVVNAKEEDKVLGWVDIHHLCNIRMVTNNLMSS